MERINKDDLVSDLFHSVEGGKLESKTSNEILIRVDSEVDFIRIRFNKDIHKIRGYDYSWHDVESCSVVNNFCVKAIKFNNGVYLQAENNKYVWELNSKDKSVLTCHFKGRINSVVDYTGVENTTVVSSAIQTVPKTYKMFFTNKGILEVSRSKVPFVGIICFTDHCDYDTAENLEVQRSFFLKHQIKVTKGFFINHYSKRKDNASMERDFGLLWKWEKDGHELAYHSLTQSIKPIDESWRDFSTSKYKGISTWIDHGYQPYNLSLYKNSNIDEAEFANELKKKGIELLWNYIDSGTSSTHVINQLNPSHFCLSAYLKSHKGVSFKIKAMLMLKNVLFHYFAEEKLILNYKRLALNFKSFIKNKKVKSLLAIIGNLYEVFFPILSVVIFWKKSSKKVYPRAKYIPLFFEHVLNGESFHCFQTLEMIDFEKSLDPVALDLLIEESGVCIAHTYFSVPLEYHHGRLIKGNKINPIVDRNFEYLSDCISKGKLWNPTLNELFASYKVYNDVKFNINKSGEIEFEEGISLQNNMFRYINE
ncbi:MAG: hypothetical protein H6584_07305 [Flavobacteriales bacterium]|nr:hypothetical protein [Flavobacteriales bacterium]